MERLPSLNEATTAIVGLDEAGLDDDDYVHVDCTDSMDEQDKTVNIQLTPNIHSFPQPPPVSSTESLAYRDTSTRSDEVAVAMGSQELHLGSDWGSMEPRPLPGKTASFLESRGFGWLLDVEDQEEDMKPLL